MDLKKFKNIVQSSHINFLFGSGLSRPYLSVLGQIETLLTEAEYIKDDEKVKELVKVSLYAHYFKSVMQPCMGPGDNTSKADYDMVHRNYRCFLKTWNQIIAKRSVGLLDKQINIFTTNVDNFVELAAETEGVEFNDGFKGHHKPIYREDSFTNVISKVSTLYSNSAMIPVFNYLKIHGSINWVRGEGIDEVYFDGQLKLISEIAQKLDRIKSSVLFPFEDTKEQTIQDITDFAKKINKEQSFAELKDFIEKYNELVMVNPRKTKFKETVIDLHFYELMRIFSNALEQSTTLLIVAGFSFADEHISKIVVREANANPTLQVLVFAYDNGAGESIQSNLNKAGAQINNNVVIVTPELYKKWMENDKIANDLVFFDFPSLNKYVFQALSNAI